jgi:S-sulfo-L-cysteine synthase (O-acetyl-L-serine-dependent)
MMTTFGSSLLQRIGNTPLLRLKRLTAHLPGVQIVAKAEWMNPGGSAKDRAAAAIVADAKQRGLLVPGKRLLDASSGNVGVSYAMLGAALRFPVTLCLPENASPEKKKAIAAFAAETFYTPADAGMDGAILKARELAGDDPNRYRYVDQFSNDVNWQAHYQSTGIEIWEQTQGRVTHFVAGVGSSGTFLGTTRKLKQYNSKQQAIALQPDSPNTDIAGWKHISTTLLPAIYSPYLADRTELVGADEAREMASRLAREEGLLVGLSGAAAVAASLRIAEELNAAEGRSQQFVVATILCDRDLA